MNALLDTNVLIDYLNGIDAAREELARYGQTLISPITWMEVMVGAGPEDEDVVREFLARFSLVPIDAAVAEESVRLRRQRNLCLPDAIIWASAITANALLVTRNIRHFPTNEPGIRIPYNL